MSLAVWPRVSPSELKDKVAETHARELAWATDEIVEVCTNIKHGLEDCYALLAPIDPGSTLVMSTPRNEKVKGTITRVGTRIVKGSLNLQLRMTPLPSIAIATSYPIHIPALVDLHTHLTQAIDLLSLTLSPDNPRRNEPSSLSSTLSLLADSLASATSLLRGPPAALSDPTWQRSSCSSRHFDPPLPPNVSFHVGLQESSIVVWLRVLEQVDAPVHFGMKLGLAIGTVRRLEHDEMDLVFRYNTNGRSPSGSATPSDDEGEDCEDVYVREKVQVDSADPSLMSLYSKLGYLSHILGHARRNLAAVMGEDFDGKKA